MRAAPWRPRRCAAACGPPPGWVPEGLEAKIAAGAQFIQTQFCMDAGVVRRYMARLSERGIAGITCANDVTARDLQKADGQWTRAKGFDTFCPVGPRVAPPAELGGLDALEVRCRVTGQERQHGTAADMAFPIPVVLSYISQFKKL